VSQHLPGDIPGTFALIFVIDIEIQSNGSRILIDIMEFAHGHLEFFMYY